MDNFTFAQEFERFADVTVADHAEEVIVRDSGLLFCGEVFVEIGKNIPFYADILHIRGDTGRCLRIYARRMIDKIRVKSGFPDLFFAETAGKLVQNRPDHLNMCQFFCTCKMLIKKPAQKNGGTEVRNRLSVPLCIL